MTGRNEDKRRGANAFFLLHKHTHQTPPGVRNSEAPVSPEPVVKHLLVKACECEFQIRAISTSGAWVCPVLSAGFYKYSLATEWKKRNVPDLNSSLLRKRTILKTTGHILQV